MRSVCLPIRMICSAPSRLAASTPHSPTAPSPITVTVWPGWTPAVIAPWWPVQYTSDRVSSGSEVAIVAPILTVVPTLLLTGKYLKV